MSFIPVVAMFGALALVMSSSSAQAIPVPAGATTIQSEGEFTLMVLGAETVVPFTSQFVGTSDGAGKVTFPQSGSTVASGRSRPS